MIMKQGSSTDKSEKMQIEQIKIFANQIDEKSKEYDKFIITGDSKLCANKSNNVDYTKKKIANPLKNAIEQNGLTVYPVENTYLADHLLKNGSIPESALDHMYYSKSIKDRIECKIS